VEDQYPLRDRIHGIIVPGAVSGDSVLFLHVVAQRRPRSGPGGRRFQAHFGLSSSRMLLSDLRGLLHDLQFFQVKLELIA